MASTIAQHAFIGNGRGSALIDRSACIDWLCLPRFDSPACFAALLGNAEHGHWALGPRGEVRRSQQTYRDQTMVVDTELETADGRILISDCMPIDPERAEVIRIVRGLAGRVPIRSRLAPRFGYGARTPQLHMRDGVALALDGEDAMAATASVPLRLDAGVIAADFELDRGSCATFAITLGHGERPPDPPLNPETTLGDCERWWRDWAARCNYDGPWRAEVLRSLLTLKALIYAPTGGMVAAPTTSLPEIPGGVRNWDYRYCWLRDAAFTLLALLGNGYRDEARQWRDWLVDAVRRDPFTLHVLYRIDCSTELDERELQWLPGHMEARPVRVGNAAVDQFQLDTRGEVMDVLHIARLNGLESRDDAWELQVALLEELERRWCEPDHGIWEMRGSTAHFVHSKALAWVAFDRGLRAALHHHPQGPVDRWRRIRDEIRSDIMAHGFDRERGTFVQRYGASDLDASTLLLPLVGFVDPGSPEAVGTVDAIRRELTHDGLVHRYSNDTGVDGLPGHEGAFLPCSFWLVDNLALSGRTTEAQRLFERLLSLCNHVGLLGEEWHPQHGMLGNLPLALSHVGLVNSARILTDVLHRGTPPPRTARPEERAATVSSELLEGRLE